MKRTKSTKVPPLALTGVASLKGEELVVVCRAFEALSQNSYHLTLLGREAMDRVLDKMPK